MSKEKDPLNFRKISETSGIYKAEGLAFTSTNEDEVFKHMLEMSLFDDDYIDGLQNGY